jgi:hypothetical protein
MASFSAPPGGTAQHDLPTRGRTGRLWLVYRFPVGNGMGLTGVTEVDLGPPGSDSALLLALRPRGILGKVVSFVAPSSVSALRLVADCRCHMALPMRDKLHRYTM